MFPNTEEKLVEATNGRICCTLREDLPAEVAALGRAGRLDYLLIESTKEDNRGGAVKRWTDISVGSPKRASRFENPKRPWSSWK